MFRRKGYVQAAYTPAIHGITGGLHEMLLQGRPAPPGIFVEFQQRLGELSVVKTPGGQDIGEDRGKIPRLQEGGNIPPVAGGRLA